MRTHLQLQVSRQRYKRHVPDDQRCWSRCMCITPPALSGRYRASWRMNTNVGQWGVWARDLLTDWKIAFCLPHPPLRPPLRGNPLEFLDETYPRKTRGMGLVYGENCVVLPSTVFDWSTHVTNGQTDKQTDGIAMAYTRYSIYAVARKNGCVHCYELPKLTTPCVGSKTYV